MLDMLNPEVSLVSQQAHVFPSFILVFSLQQFFWKCSQSSKGTAEVWPHIEILGSSLVNQAVQVPSSLTKLMFPL